MTHTAGPWDCKYRKENDSFPNRWLIISARKIVAKVGDFPEAESNARLIASAPELLHELEHLLALLEPLEADGILGVPGLATLNAARAAIAKAKGER